MADFKNLTFERYPEIHKEDRDGYSTKTGFQSPTDDHQEGRIDFIKLLIPNPTATIPILIEGQSMREANIKPGDILLVDKSIKPENGSVVLAVVNDAFTVRIWWMQDSRLFLIPSNKNYRTIEVSEDSNVAIEGVVTFIIHNAKKNNSSR